MSTAAKKAGAGVLVLGMHRSGTSALARVLGLCGADLGARVLGASAGNQTGHWEDAVAVEIHERLLAALGLRWDDPVSLPADWLTGEAGRRAAAAVHDYLRDDRARTSLWAAKDPRLGLFAEAWERGAAGLGLPLSAVVLLRHPAEVARSLSVRDGIAPGRGLLLWLEYTLASLETAARLPHRVIGYDQLLADWRGVLATIAKLPGCDSLATPGPEASAEVSAFLDPALRHHREADDASLPEPVREVWQQLRACAQGAGSITELLPMLRARLAPVRELLQPVLEESRLERRLLWERIGRAEAPMAAAALSLPDKVGQLRELVQIQHGGLIEAISGDLRRMQDTCAAAQDHALQLSEALRAREAELAEARRELSVQQYSIDQLSEQARQLELVKASRTWRWTRPLRVLGRLLRGQLGADDQARLRTRVRGAIAKAPLISDKARASLVGRNLAEGSRAPSELPGQGELAGVTLAAAKEGLPDVFVWSVIDWHFRIQRPQHLARALAGKGHRVFYVSNHFHDAAEPGFRVEPLDDSGRLFQVHLNLAGRPPIYFGMPADDQVEALRADLARLLAWTGTQAGVSLVQHPYWLSLARAVPAARVVYDCMDHHGGFENNAPAILDAEARLVADADLVVVTSGWLEAELGPRARAVAMVRNAGEYAFFHQRPDKVFADGQGRRVIGYYGAIAEWFDLDLVRAVAQAQPDALVLLVGNDTAGAGEALADLANVRLTGEVPYADLPYWLHGFDVCLLPFKVIPLTLATNPVKVYEYLAAGKPVVSVDLPEMAQFDGLVRVAGDPAAFVAAVGAALADGPGEGAAARQAFAASQTWEHRAETFDRALAELNEPLVSVVVLTYNNLAFTQACLASIEAHSDYGNLEVIVVDNASSDGSPEWLRQWAEAPSPAGHQRRLILNEDNLGFSAGNNVGLRAARGEFLVLLNNDTYVTPGWVRGLCNHLRADPGLGLLGPVTNNIGNEAKLDIGYDGMDEMLEKAALHTRAHPGQRRPLRTAAFFCVAMRRDVYQRVGDMDEDFGVGFFEDDDYCRRVEQAGLSVACAEDVFVHHHLSASFDALKAETKRELFDANRAIYEKKWGPWTPHVYR
ncbi:glycosyltransferase [Arenimonas donghaensis]|uniref:Glycosyltransferase 2-like domain-containing protein n=1 Tax=Arenimonas donghaensis DSM 18148 = HO3-R19 TaxID=1121014 RepID=A0A087MFU3_9GAMM|nr:glycosyltransferase [Arenimonas donghaensis]KFL35746.1 hypothetical protein N788_07465 [Arenimonas donghaensis DSM 18148 = HO3-R19]